MLRYICCCKTKLELEGLEEPPYQNKLGIKIYKNVSKRSWALWLKKQTMIINEYRLDLSVRKVREFIFKQTEIELLESAQPFLLIQKTKAQRP